MNNQEFIYWLNGFADAVGKEGPTPKQWETIVSELNNIKEPISFPIGGKGWGTPNTAPIWQQPHYPNPSDINRVTCNTDDVIAISGSTSTQGIITDGFMQNVSVTKANPPFTLTYTTGKPVKYKANVPEEDNHLPSTVD